VEGLVPEHSRPSARSQLRRRPLVIGVTVIVAVLVIGGATAWAVSGSGNSGYRMAKVVRASIAESQDVVSTIEPVNDASASFQVAGQVATVTATVGQQVTAGESLGTLDTTSLSEAVSSATSSVASDQAQLTADEESETATTTTTTTAPTTTTTTSPTANPGGKSGVGTGSGSISQDQANLVADQATESADQQQEAADLTQAKTACEALGGSPPSPTGTSPGGGSSPTPTSTTTTTTSPTSTGTGTGTSSSESACTSALDLVSTAQQTVGTDQNAVATAEGILAKALTQEESSSGGSSTSSSPTSSTGSSGSGSGTGAAAGSGAAATGKAGAGGTGGSAESSPSDSAATIASDEAAIDMAQADLINAQQSLSDAELTSPISGTIASVGITVGSTVSADSSSDATVIIGTQSFEATATLTSSEVTSVKVGDTAGVLVDGATKAITGTVSQVGPVQSSDGSYTYPVVVSLPSSAAGLFTGSSASVSIVTSQVKNVLSVPTSAVNTDATHSYVVVLSNGNPVDKTVKLGIVGYTYTQVTSGLTQGESVVLADYSEAVPSSNTSTEGGFGGGGFGGAGGFGGGGGRFTAGGAPSTFGR
jgi:multidrug efflux pump subunit AcrA (membrane-fusion protein)